MRLAIFTHVTHKEQNGRYYAYSPYVREMNLWLKIPHTVEIVAPMKDERLLRDLGTGGKGEMENRGLGDSYKHPNLIFNKIPAFDLLSIGAVFQSIFKIPIVFFRIVAAMRKADHLHLRCPGNVGLLAVIAQVFFPQKKKTVKYAGNWDPEARQPWSYRLQKWILSNTFLSRNIKVLVYGEWSGQSRNIVSFFTASFSENDREQVIKEFKPPYRFIYTGNLVEGKGIAEAIELIASLRARELDCRLDIYGDGKLEDSLKKLVQENRLQDFIRFYGRVSLEDLKEAYRKTHFSVLLSRSEGWPKAIAEAMWYGCVPVTSSVSCLPWMLKAPSAPEGGTLMTTLGLRGILVPDPRCMILDSKFKIQGSKFKVQSSKFKVQRFTDIGEKVLALIENPDEYRKMSFEAQEWSQSYTLEGFEEGIHQILENEQSTRFNRKPTTDNRELTTDNPKLQTSNYEHLRVLQITDSLIPGGAERMAVNIANALVGEVEASFLCCTRKEGLLKQELNGEVGYFFAGKKYSVDLGAFLRLREFIKRERINLLHAHGTSWFWGVLLKISGLDLNLVWQDHYGESERLEQRKVFLLKALARFFDGVIAVNSKLASWAREALKVDQIIQLNNFVVAARDSSSINLKGNPGDFKIICVANLRPQKDHLNLLEAFELVCQEVDNVSLHLVGLDPETEYSSSIFERIKISEAGKRIFYYGSISGVTGLLEQADIGVLSSRSEGLPLALLEYGLVGLPVVCTKVGDCAKVIGDEGIIVAAGDSEALSLAILKFIRNSELRAFLGYQLKKRTIENYGESKYLKDLVAFYKML